MKASTTISLIHLALMPFLIMLRGWVLTKLWGWFIVLPFGAPQINLWVASGIALLVATVTYQLQRTPSDDSESEKEKRALDALSYSVFGPLFALGFGAIYHAFR